jgi:hypothetical protein
VTETDLCGTQQGLCKARAELASVHGLGEACGYDPGVCSAGLVCSRNTCLLACRVDAPTGGFAGCASGSHCFVNVNNELIAPAFGACDVVCEVGGDDCAEGWCAPQHYDVAAGRWIGRCWVPWRF